MSEGQRGLLTKAELAGKHIDIELSHGSLRERGSFWLKTCLSTCTLPFTINRSRARRLDGSLRSQGCHCDRKVPSALISKGCNACKKDGATAACSHQNTHDTDELMVRNVVRAREVDQMTAAHGDPCQPAVNSTRRDAPRVCRLKRVHAAHQPELRQSEKARGDAAGTCGSALP